MRILTVGFVLPAGKKNYPAGIPGEQNEKVVIRNPGNIRTLVRPRIEINRMIICIKNTFLHWFIIVILYILLDMCNL